MAEIFTYTLTGYMLLGALFAVLFLAKGAAAVDPGMEGTSIWMRLMLVPGTVALWPHLAIKWWKLKRPE